MTGLYSARQYIGKYYCDQFTKPTIFKNWFIDIPVNQFIIVLTTKRLHYQCGPFWPKKDKEGGLKVEDVTAC